MQRGRFCDRTGIGSEPPGGTKKHRGLPSLPVMTMYVPSLPEAAAVEKLLLHLPPGPKPLDDDDELLKLWLVV